MKRTIAIRFDATAEQQTKLRALRAAFVAACNAAAIIAFEHSVTNRVRLHHLAYYELRNRFPDLGSQMTCNAIKAAADSLKTHRSNGRPWTIVVFGDEMAVHFDARTYRVSDGKASLYTMSGRELVQLRMGDFQRGYLERGKIKEASLVERRARWYLHVVLDLSDAVSMRGTRVLGVDLGENVAAATSGGSLYGGGRLRDKRDRYLALRKRLQCNGSRSAKQLLKRVSGRESRHMRHVNHEISARIIAEAVTSGCSTIAMENLTNIRTRVKAGKRMRTRLHRWAWRQLQQFVEYKALGVGLTVVYVYPAYTSRTCVTCGNVGARRKHRFSCKICGIFAHSDRNAARNIAKIGASAVTPTGDVMRPHVAA